MEIKVTEVAPRKALCISHTGPYYLIGQTFDKLVKWADGAGIALEEAVRVLEGKPSFSPEEYLARERQTEFKSEYQDGRIYAMAGGSPQYSEIAANTIGELRAQLKGKPCHVYTSDLKIGSATSRQFSYPDVSVVCGELKYHSTEKDVVTNPVLIAEVLSDTTEANDRGDKFFRYRQLETLTNYLMISQKRPYIEHYEKQADGRWLLATTALGLEASVPIESLGCTLLLSEVYDKIQFTDSEPTNQDGSTGISS